MDLSCIISSGDLELYVLGMLPEEEAHQIGQLALLFPEVRAELDAISEALEQSAVAAAATLPAPSAQLKAGLMSRIRTLGAEESASASATVLGLPPRPEATAPANSRVIEFAPPAGRRRFPMGMAAALAGLLICGGGLFYALKKNGEQGQQLAVLQQRVGTLNDSMGSQRQKLQTYASLVSYMKRPNMKAIRLMPRPNMPQDAMAQVFWDTASHEVMVANLSLPAAPSGKQYQLWAIVDGKPVDAGMLSADRMMPERMKAFASAQAFAITLEKAGGSSTPTMEALYVMGSA